jgi:phosphosulfolactate synthase
MASLKISMACWMLADERVIRDKVRAVAEHGVQSVSGGGPFEIAVVQGRLEEYLDLCASIGFGRIEAGQGFTSTSLDPHRIVRMAHDRGLQVQYELGGKHAGSFDSDETRRLIGVGQSWLEAGAVELVLEARESAAGVGLFAEDGTFNGSLADRFAEAFSLVTFEAPTKPSQFELLDHFGPEARLCNVRLEELLRVEIYRHGIHADAFNNPRLAPRAPLNTIRS